MIDMPRRPTIDRRASRIIPPTFSSTNPVPITHENPQITQQSTYSEIIDTYTTLNVSDTNSDSVQEYDEWIKSAKNKHVGKSHDGLLAITPTTGSLIKRYSKKAKKGAKVDKIKLFQEGRDGRSPTRVFLPSLLSWVLNKRDIN